MEITADTKICIIIGDPVEHSLSPQMHNAGYKALKIDDKFVYVGCNVKRGQLGDLIKGVLAMQIHGVTVTIPHKVEIMKYLDTIDEVAKKIDAVNTIINRNGTLIGYNTDWLGILNPLQKLTTIRDKKIALLGAGGAAHAAAYAIATGGGDLTIYNRTLEKAEKLAKSFGAKAKSLIHLPEVKNADIIVNTTSMGLHPHEDETPVPIEFITERHIVFDAVYSALSDTKLLKDAKKKGATTISGIEMLLNQGYAQFKLFTGHNAPEEKMREALLKSFTHES